MNSFALAITCLLSTSAADPAKLAAQKEALQPFGVFVGKWKGTGIPDAPAGASREFWAETIEWEWKFKGDAAWLAAKFEKSPRYTAAELRYDTEKKQFQYELTTAAKETHSFLGTLATTKDKQQVLTVERTDAKLGITQRLVVTILHNNRHLYRLEEQPNGMKTFTRKFQVGATKEGEPFANVPQGPECIVSGGRGTIRVSHKGTDYYVCCSGCRDAFKDEPEKFIAEFQAKKKKEAEAKEKK